MMEHSPYGPVTCFLFLEWLSLENTSSSPYRNTHIVRYSFKLWSICAVFQ